MMLFKTDVLMYEFVEILGVSSVEDVTDASHLVYVKDVINSIDNLDDN